MAQIAMTDFEVITAAPREACSPHLTLRTFAPTPCTNRLEARCGPQRRCTLHGNRPVYPETGHMCRTSAWVDARDLRWHRLWLYQLRSPGRPRRDHRDLKVESPPRRHAPTDTRS